ncbi:hypothetical protein HKCCE4037_14725, partial [Rhodobacterales bacterium HKCCE4037]|nr:hypothetical protein [Rhodobacterales bacterium HKCCE4037]
MVGTLAAVLLWVLGGWSFMQGAFMAVLVTLILGAILTITMCNDGSRPAQTGTGGGAASGSTGPAGAAATGVSAGVASAAPAADSSAEAAAAAQTGADEE